MALTQALTSWTSSTATKCRTLRTMPRMDGAEVFRKLIRAQPDVRVILMSGFDEKSSLDSLGSPGPACFLQKPFQLSDVSKRLRLALGVD